MADVVDLHPGSASGRDKRRENHDAFIGIGQMMIRRTDARTRRKDVVISFETEAEAETLLHLIETIRKRRPK
jgi:hypothetical protein